MPEHVPHAQKTMVLAIEDEPQMRRLLRTALGAHDHRVIEAATGAEGVRLAAEHVPDLVLVDLGLPDVDGVEVVRRIREWSMMPIVVLSARNHERQKVEALDAGADDYVTKPFGLAELLARIRVALRNATRRESSSAAVFTSGPLRVDMDARRVSVDGRDVHLSPIEYKLLCTLAKNAGRVMTHNQLLQAVWGPGGADQPHYLRVYMAHLRRKIEPAPARPRLFLTETGVGYRLAAD